MFQSEQRVKEKDNKDREDDEDDDLEESEEVSSEVKCPKYLSKWKDACEKSEL